MRQSFMIKALLVACSLCCWIGCTSVALTKKNSPEYWNQQGITFRQQGKFIEAEQAYQQAIAKDERYANAWLNLGILYELYRPDAEKARHAYERFQSLQSTADPEVAAWLKTVAAQQAKNPQKTEPDAP
jgi:tetratricopeptide (TPR) repeat protein